MLNMHFQGHHGHGIDEWGDTDAAGCSYEDTSCGRHVTGICLLLNFHLYSEVDLDGEQENIRSVDGSKFLFRGVVLSKPSSRRMPILITIATA